MQTKANTDKTLPKVFRLIQAKTEVPRDVRNSKVRKQDKIRRDWSQH